MGGSGIKSQLYAIMFYIQTKSAVIPGSVSAETFFRNQARRRLPAKSMPPSNNAISSWLSPGGAVLEQCETFVAARFPVLLQWGGWRFSPDLHSKEGPENTGGSAAKLGRTA